MSIKTIQSLKLKQIWEKDRLSVLPNTYRYQVRDILFDLDAAFTVSDLEDIGAIQYNSGHDECWSVTVTVNNVEPCGAVICDFWQGNCYNVDLREYDA